MNFFLFFFYTKRGVRLIGALPSPTVPYPRGCAFSSARERVPTFQVPVNDLRMLVGSYRGEQGLACTSSVFIMIGIGLEDFAESAVYRKDEPMSVAIGFERSG